MHTIFNQSGEVRVPLVLVQYKVMYYIYSHRKWQEKLSFILAMKRSAKYMERRSKNGWNEAYVNR